MQGLGAAPRRKSIQESSSSTINLPLRPRKNINYIKENRKVRNISLYSALKFYFFLFSKVYFQRINLGLPEKIPHNRLGLDRVAY